MGQELTPVLCPECGTPGAADPSAGRWQCTACGNGFFLRRCAACSRVSHVSGLQGFRMPWPCTWCGQVNEGFSQNQDPATATVADLAADTARHGPARGPAERGTGGQPDQAPSVNSGPAPAGWEPADAPRPGRRRVRWLGVWTTVAVACAAAVYFVMAAGSPKATGMAVGLTANGSAQRPVQVIVGGVGTIDFHGVPGQLAIAATGSRQVSLTGQLSESGSAPVIETQVDRATGVLSVSVRCASARPCTEDLRLAVPSDAGVTIRQPGGRVVLARLAGSLSIVGANVDVSASGLRSPSLTAAITSGHLSATFSSAPRQVSVTLTSAQARLRLPGSDAYRVAQEVTSGYVRVGIPRAAGATRTVTARIDSGELDLLPYPASGLGGDRAGTRGAA